MSSKQKIKKSVLLVEDDLGVVEQIRKLLKKYEESIQLLVAENAGEALKILFPNTPIRHPDALVIDIMMPYGDAENQLNAQSDQYGKETGLCLLNYIREKEQEFKFKFLWVTIITARSAIAIDNKANELHAKVFYKPFNTLRFEDSLVCALDVESQVPSFLLSDETHEGACREES